MQTQKDRYIVYLSLFVVYLMLFLTRFQSG